MNQYAARLYALAPAWAQNLMLTGYATVLDRERHGGRFREYRELLQRTERWSRTELEAFQDERLREIVSHAYATVPYYRQLFDQHRLTPADIRGRADLPKIPLLTREAIRTRSRDLLSCSTPRRAVRMGHTSGTTGTPLTVGYDQQTIWANYAALDRHYRWAGCRPGHRGDRSAVFRGNVIVPLRQKRPPFWRVNRRQNQLLLSSFHLSPATLPVYLKALTAFAPTLVDGYPSTLYVLARFLKSQGLTFPVRAAVTSSETLYDFQRAAIESAFKCPVFDYYAMAERVLFAGECDRHEGHHLAMEYGVAEVVDAAGSTVGPGAYGRLVGTSLHNTAMPLLRYVTNDIGALKRHECSCGRGLALMEDVTTKAEDVLTLHDGRLISPSVLTHPFKPLDCIDGSQIVQEAPDAVSVRVIPGSGFTAQHSRMLVQELQVRLGEGVHIEVQLVDRLEVAPNGKFKWVISHVPLGI